MTKEAAQRWVGVVLWQIRPSGTPVPFEVIGFAGPPGGAALEPNGFKIHLLQAEEPPQAYRWDPSAPSFVSQATALECTLTTNERLRLEAISERAFARRGFGSLANKRVTGAPLDLFTFAAWSSLRLRERDSAQQLELFAAVASEATAQPSGDAAPFSSHV